MMEKEPEAGVLHEASTAHVCSAADEALQDGHMAAGQGGQITLQRKPERNNYGLSLPDVRHAVSQQDGVLIVRKPKGPTSAWCITRIKHGLGQKKIGHAGTLDPMAEGVLVVLLGQATKISGYLMDEESHKVYSGVIRLGVVTDTWDAEGQILEEHPSDHITQADVEREFATLQGAGEQEVPAYSAAKHQGTPLYALARKGKPVPVKTKTVTIFRGEAELVGPSRIHFRVTCSSGTYIRSLAHSLGSRLGCGGMLEELVREYSHPFALSAAHSLEDVLRAPEGFSRKVTGIAEALPGWPSLSLNMAEAAAVRNGRPVAHTPDRMTSSGSEAGAGHAPEPAFVPGTKAILRAPSGEPLALAQLTLLGGEPAWTLLRGLWNQES